MEIFSTNIGVIHTLFGVISIIAGALVIGQKKGTSTHKKTGYVYVASMILLNLTGLFTHVLYQFGPFHWLAIVSLLGVLAGMSFPIFFRKIKRWLLLHYYFMLWSYVGLIAALFSEIIVRVPQLNSASYFWPMVIFVSLITYFIGGYIIESKKGSILGSGN